MFGHFISVGDEDILRKRVGFDGRSTLQRRPPKPPAPILVSKILDDTVGEYWPVESGSAEDARGEGGGTKTR